MWPQGRAQGGTRPGQSRFDGPHGDAERRRDFFVTQAVNLPKHDRRALIEWQLPERVPDQAGGLALLKHPVRLREAARLGQLALLRRMLLERNLLRLPAPAPPSKAVRRVIDHDAIDPGAQRGLPTEVIQPAK